MLSVSRNGGVSMQTHLWGWGGGGAGQERFIQSERDEQGGLWAQARDTGEDEYFFRIEWRSSITQRRAHDLTGSLRHVALVHACRRTLARARSTHTHTDTCTHRHMHACKLEQPWVFFHGLKNWVFGEGVHHVVPWRRLGTQECAHSAYMFRDTDLA